MKEKTSKDESRKTQIPGEDSISTLNKKAKKISGLLRNTANTEAWIFSCEQDLKAIYFAMKLLTMRSTRKPKRIFSLWTSNKRDGRFDSKPIVCLSVSITLENLFCYI